MNAAVGSAPVTVLISRRVRPGRAAEFVQLMAGMRAAAARYPGHMGGFLIEPGEGDRGSYHMLFAFDSEPHLQAWTESAERQTWLERIAEVAQAQGPMRVLSGLEGWFALPAAQTRQPPPRHKMAVVTWLGIFPLVLLLSYTVAPLLAPHLHPVLGIMVVTAFITVAMTWLVMPVLARLFAGWLYPKTAGPAPGNPDSRSASPSTEKS